ncbi:Protein NRT1/ PTR FAMILY 5.8 [Linum grandiflorum]
MSMAGEKRPKSGLNKACCLLIVISGMERFAFKGVASNLVTYLTDVVKMSNSAAAKTVNNWCGLTSMLPLLVASLSESYWGRCSTILASCFLYIVGLVALTSTAMAWGSYPSSSMSYSFLFGSLCLISLGQGGYNPSLQAFGAEQLPETEDASQEEDSLKPSLKSKFFQWWYYGVCAGSLMGVMVMSYIQDNIGWVPGFAIPTLAMVASMALFCVGGSVYRITLSARHDSEAAELELQEKPLCTGKLGNLMQQPMEANNKNNKKKKTSNLVKNSKVVLRLLPIWAMLLPFAVIFQQPATFFTKQGMTMERTIIASSSTKFSVPPATLQSSITISILLLMPLYDRTLIPLSRVVTRDKRGITVMQRMGIGMFLSIIAMVIAALVETKRLQISREMVGEEGTSSLDHTVPMKIYWLLPQYVLLGISDIFTVVGMQEFFYGEVPVEMRTLGIALYTSVFGVGSFMSAVLICLVEWFARLRNEKSWFSDDMREARLDKYYWLLAILSSGSLVLYVILCRFYKGSKDDDDDDDEEDDQIEQQKDDRNGGGAESCA